ncbi:MAG: response regulator [Oscillospiraceae bacterium]|nr:response regulator [Oscillospiraceae bacterium]
MTILCVDRSLLGLMDLKHKVKAVRPNAVVYGCREPDKALSIAKSEGCDVLLTEIDLGGSQREGLDFALRMQAIHPAVNIIFVTTFEESDFARDVIQMRVSGFVRKPFTQQQLEEEFAKLRYAVK